MKHTVIWIDHREARVFELDDGGIDQFVVHSPSVHVHRHANDDELRTGNHPDEEPRFFREVSRRLDGRGQVLVVGPAQTKLHFFRYVQRHEHALEERIVGLETVDHPTDAQLVAHLRHYFHESAPRHSPST
jgi:hypothetical protein